MPEEAIPLVFYQTEAGNEPVREWLLDLEAEDCREIGYKISDVQHGWPVGMPLCRSLGNGLWEVRVRLPSDKIARVIIIFYDSELVALHGFIKKSQKTPQADIDLALKRKKEYIG